MATATLERPVKDSPKPRVIDPSSRVKPTYKEIERREAYDQMNFKHPPKMQYRKESDYPEELELGWQRFICRGIDAIVTPDGFRVREKAWPILYILAPNREAAEACYRSSVSSEMNAARRKKEHLEVVIDSPECGD